MWLWLSQQQETGVVARLPCMFHEDIPKEDVDICFIIVPAPYLSSPLPKILHCLPQRPSWCKPNVFRKGRAVLAMQMQKCYCQIEGRKGRGAIPIGRWPKMTPTWSGVSPAKNGPFHSPETQPLPELGRESLWELPGRTCLVVAGVEVALPPPLQQVLERGQAAFLGRRGHLPGHAPRHSHSPTPLGQPGTGPPPPPAAFPTPRRPRARQPAPTTRSGDAASQTSAAACAALTAG